MENVGERQAMEINVKYDRSKTSRIAGFGSVPLNTLGSLKCYVELYGIDMGESSFYVVEDNVMEYDIIVGKDFMKKNDLCKQ